MVEMGSTYRRDQKYTMNTIASVIYAKTFYNALVNY